jgi:hypothetical protein
MTMFTAYFETGQLRYRSDLEVLNLSEVEDFYKLVPVCSRNWKSSEFRLLVVVEAVDRQDLKTGKLLSMDLEKERGSSYYANTMTALLPGLLDASWKMYTDWLAVDNETPEVSEVALGVVNFNAAKTYTLEPTARKAMHKKFADRVIHVIDSMKPTHVFVCGDTATVNLLELLSEQDVPHCEVKRGWVFDLTHKNHKFKLVPSLDLETLYNPKANESADDDDGDSDMADKYATADLLYFVGRNLVNLFAGRHLYSLKRLRPKAVYVDTVEQFDKVMDLVESPDVEYVGTDTEGASLNVVTNKIFSVQFAVDTKVGYVIPLLHPDTPFDGEELKYVFKRLRKFFGATKEASLKTLVYINGKFDLRFLRVQLGIPVILHRTYEVNAGEQLLDENIGLFGGADSGGLRFRKDNDKVRTSYQGLMNALCLYENDAYYNLQFSKEDRGNMGAQPLNDPDVLYYCAHDSVAVLAMARMQIRRAKHTFVRPNFDSKKLVPYYKYFIRHVVLQMGATVQGLSYMEQNGSPIDLEYLTILAGKKSPLLAEINQLNNDMRAFPSVAATEKLLLKSMGRSGGGLLGSVGTAGMFDISKRDHLHKLFYEVMKLKVVSHTGGGAVAIDKEFINTYSADYKEVATFGQYTKVTKLMSTYVKGWLKKIQVSVDDLARSVLSPGFGFFTIVTGRLNSFKPSLQNVPSRGGTAKIIKRMFRAPKGFLSVNFDYSANEIRGGAILAKDDKLAGAFQDGIDLRKQWIVKPSAELAASLATRGDVHIQNVKRLFGVWVAKSDPRRNAIKAVVFGLMYGKGAGTLGKDLKKDALNEAMDKRRSIVKQIRELEKEVS